MAGKHTIEGNTGSQGRAAQVPGGALGKQKKRGKGGQSASETRDEKLDESKELEATDSDDEIEDEIVEEDMDDEEEDLEEENEGGGGRRH